MSNVLTNYTNDQGLELVVNNNTGECFASISATARMCEVTRQAIQKFIGRNQIELITAEIQTAGGIQGGNLLNEKQILKCILRYNQALAEKCMEAGLRVFLQGQIGLTPELIIQNRMLSPAPTPWERRFEPYFYEELSRLTGLNPKGHRRPNYWAALTNEFVYDYLPGDITERLRELRDEGLGWTKLHQHLSPEGLDIFGKHMESLFYAMKFADSVPDLRKHLLRLKGIYQLNLLTMV